MARLKLRDFIRDDRGAVAIWIGIGLVGIFGVATLAVDGGQLYVMRNRLQITADSAAAPSVPGAERRCQTGECKYSVGRYQRRPACDHAASLWRQTSFW